ncbi:MAG TPA: hypothetical protein VHF89_16730 [Solirubrobacteraceae bacterium]|nr:hypothetical protein [Solirubrobacteraceae bacterium]
MVASGTLIGAGLIGLLLVGLGVINPLLLIPIVLLGALPLALGVVAKVFSHSQPTVDASTGPATPSTAEASYNPVNEPR